MNPYQSPSADTATTDAEIACLLEDSLIRMIAVPFVTAGGTLVATVGWFLALGAPDQRDVIWFCVVAMLAGGLLGGIADELTFRWSRRR